MKQLASIILYIILPAFGILFIGQTVYEFTIRSTDPIEINGYYSCSSVSVISRDRLVKVLAISIDKQQIKTVAIRNLWFGGDLQESKKVLDQVDGYLAALHQLNRQLGDLHDSLYALDETFIDRSQQIYLLRETIMLVSRDITDLEIFDDDTFRLTCNYQSEIALENYWDE